MEVETNKTAVLEARDLYRFYHAGDEETLALRGVSLALAAGEFVAVTGPSGSGKSTLIACLAGLDDPDGGVVRIAGQRISHCSESERSRLRARHIGIMRQSGNLIELLSVSENVQIARALGSGAGRGVRELLDSVGMWSKASTRASRLSGGQTARVSLAVALAGQPDIILADEPTGEVDRASEAAVVELLAAEAARGTAVLVVTHSDQVAAAASRILHLVDGELHHA
jgi:putative ABC transport system ATP-binding protein